MASIQATKDSLGSNKDDVSAIQLEPMKMGENIKQEFHEDKSWNSSHLLLIMVQLIDLSWNTIEPSLVLMYEKLINFPDFMERAQRELQ